MEGASVGSCRLGLTRRACIYLLEARIGAWAKAQSAVAIVNLVYLPMAFLSGLWIPISLLPSFVQDVAVVFPAYHQSQLALKVVALDEGGSTAVHVLMIGIFTVVFLIVAAVGFRRAGQR